jgi:hypothetical protein
MELIQSIDDPDPAPSSEDLGFYYIYVKVALKSRVLCI